MIVTTTLTVTLSKYRHATRQRASFGGNTNEKKKNSMERSVHIRCKSAGPSLTPERPIPGKTSNWAFAFEIDPDVIF
jgi:hypothetical protein